MFKYVILFFLVSTIGLVSLKVSHSFFTSSASSQQNVFSVSDVFPTMSSSPTITINPSITNLPTPTSSIEPTTSLIITPSLSPTPAVAHHIVISEVQIAGSATTQDFVELYNPTNSLIDLSGWKLRKRISTGTESSLVVITAGKSVSAHGFFLWSNNSSGYNITVGADVSNGNTLASDNSVILLMPNDTVVDKVAWGNGTNQFVESTAFSPNPTANQGIERKAYINSTTTTMNVGGSDELKGNGFDSDNNPFDFVLRSSSQPQNSTSSTESP